MSNIKLKQSAGSGTVTLKAAASGSNDVELTLPNDIGSNDQYLKLSGVSGKTGTLSFDAPSGGAALTGSTNNTITTVTGANAIQGEANLTFNGGVTGDAQLTVHAAENDSGADSQVILETSNDFASSTLMFKDSTAEAGSISYNHGDNYIKFATGGTTERLRIKSDGDVNVKTGNLVIGTDGKGIDFTADGNNAGMENELLDDYEEGQFTLEPNANLTFDDSYNSGSYIKIGKLVHVRGYFSPDSTGGTGTDNVQITLPFSAENAAEHATSGANGIMHRNIDGVGDVVCAWVAGNATKFWLFTCQDNGAWGAINNSNISDSTEVYFSFTYRAAS